MNPLESYLKDLYEIRSSGGAVKETSGYPALSQLLNEIGKALKPKVRCVINLQNQGAGLPDGGLYSAEQFQKRAKVEPLAGQLPAAGKYIGTIHHDAGKPLDPIEDLKVTAGWGHAGKGGVTMPGKGKIIERVYSTDERKAIESSVEEPSLMVGLVPRGGDRGALAQASARAQSVFELLGQTTYDVYLNDVAYWKGIPTRVWDYTIGGYQVIKKWLSYRELELLSRPLTPDEAREVMNMARRIAAIVLLEPALDANYQAVKDATYSWPG